MRKPEVGFGVVGIKILVSLIPSLIFILPVTINKNHTFKCLPAWKADKFNQLFGGLINILYNRHIVHYQFKIAYQELSKEIGCKDPDEIESYEDEDKRNKCDSKFINRAVSQRKTKEKKNLPYER